MKDGLFLDQCVRVCVRARVDSSSIIDLINTVTDPIQHKSSQLL